MTVSSPESIYQQIREEALQVLEDEPALQFLLRRTVLHESVENFNDAIAMTACYRLLLTPCDVSKKPPTIDSPVFCPHAMRKILLDCMNDTATLEMGHTMQHAVVQDIMAVCRRDPAMNTPLQVVLFSKGFCALVCHRAGHRMLRGNKKFTALFLQSQVSSMFGVDIHPGAQLGCALMLDHGTGIVMGETATVGDGCTFLHGVTLGGTGKVTGDRHPKVGNHVLIGANASLLGNIRIGDGVKIGAGSVVLRPIPEKATAVGVPAKIIGRATESKPGSDVDETLENVNLLKKTPSIPSAVELLGRGGSDTSSSEKEDTSTDGSAGTNEYDPTCPYRDYALMAKKAPKGTFSLCKLFKVLHPLGFDHAQVFSCFFEFDTNNVGYCEKDTVQENGMEVLCESLNLSKEKAAEVMKSLAFSLEAK